jgi:hypothetical protein
MQTLDAAQWKWPWDKVEKDVPVDVEKMCLLIPHES